MSVLAKQSWLRPAVLSAALLATATLAAGVMPRSAAAQYAYDYRYSSGEAQSGCGLAHSQA
jgi:hypothetical protein